MISRKASHTQHPSAASILKKAKARAFLVQNLINIRYLTGLSLSAGHMLIVPGGLRLYADPRYFERAKSSLPESIRLYPAADLLDHLPRLKSCAFEADHMTVSELQRLNKLCRKTKLIPSADAVEYFRRKKNADELANIRKACAITRKLLKAVPSLLEKNRTEQDIAWLLHQMAHKLGADEMAFETIVGFGVHTASPHHRPTKTFFRPGDLVQIDIGVKVNGYCSDFSRVYPTSPFTTDQKKAYQALLRTQMIVKKAIRPGVSTVALDKLARKELAKDGYMTDDFCHALGHGVGLEIHEGVILSGRRKDEKLLRGEVVTVEPGLYFPGKWGMRIEETVVVR